MKRMIFLPYPSKLSHNPLVPVSEDAHLWALLLIFAKLQLVPDLANQENGVRDSQDVVDPRNRDRRLPRRDGSRGGGLTQSRDHHGPCTRDAALDRTESASACPGDVLVAFATYRHQQYPALVGVER